MFSDLVRPAFVFILVFAGAAAAAQPWTFEIIDSRDGLPHNTVHALVQDARGFLWIGTADGLARYDGRQFEVYRRRPGQAGALASNTVQALALTPDGVLWVGTSAGLCRLDDEAAGQFTCMESPRDVIEVFYAEGALWISAAAAVWRLPPNPTGPVRAEQVYTGAHTSGAWNTQIAIQEGRVAVFAGVAGSRKAQRYRTAPGQNRLVADAEMHFPAETIGFLTQDGVRVVVPTAGLRETVPASGGWGRLGRLASATDPSGGIWFGGDHGLYRRTDVDLEMVDLGGSGAFGDAVLALLTDRTGALWVGTRNGLFLHDPARARFSHLDPADAGAATPVMAAVSDAEGDLWVGTLGGGLVRVAPDGSRQPVALAPRDELVWAVHPVSDGSLWLGTDGGLCRRTPRGATTCLRGSIARADDAAYIYTFEPDGAGGVWAGGSSLLHLDSRSGDLRRRIPLEDIQVGRALTALHQDRHGRLWIGVEKRGLMRLDTPDGQVQRIEIEGLDATSVWDLHEDTGGRLWLGTSEGLFALDADTRRLTAHATDLTASTVYGVTEANGNLWLSTGHGLARYDPESRTLRAYGEDDGVRTLEFNRRAIHRSADGRIHMGGMEGLTSFDPGAFDAAASPPSSVVTRIRVESRAGEAVYAASPTLRVPPGARTVALELAAPVPSGARALQYAYRLDPIDDEWIEIGEDPVVRFAGLAPGHYTFEARASRGGGIWGEPATLELTLAPRWFQTVWFRALAMLALVGLAALAVQRRIHTIRREERMRWRIASDLHDDIGSGLSSVALLTERVRDRAPLEETEARQLTSVASAARSMVESLREIVWFVDPAHERPGAFATHIQEAAASLIGPRATVEAPDRLRFDAAPLSTRRDVFLIVKEALHNAARHAPGAAVRIRIVETGRQLEVTVQDDGPGFELAATPEGTGLRSLRQRADGLGGTLEIASAPGEGTTVTLRVPAS